MGGGGSGAFGVAEQGTGPPASGTHSQASGESDINIEDGLRLTGWRPDSKYDEALLWFEYDYEVAAPPRTTSVKNFLPMAVYNDFTDADFFVTDQRGWKYMLQQMAADGNFSDKIVVNRTVSTMIDNGTNVCARPLVGWLAHGRAVGWRRTPPMGSAACAVRATTALWSRVVRTRGLCFSFTEDRPGLFLTTRHH